MVGKNGRRILGGFEPAKRLPLVDPRSLTNPPVAAPIFFVKKGTTERCEIK